ncbi:hypothetical protein, partial [Massilia sp. CFBP 13721]|uniref:hypothetical protein n=1 Tax=Massilia sp. CFBP 13721 TaxID=2775300 RepID=UPI001A7EC2C5
GMTEKPDISNLLRPDISNLPLQGGRPEPTRYLSHDRVRQKTVLEHLMIMAYHYQKRGETTSSRAANYRQGP